MSAYGATTERPSPNPRLRRRVPGTARRGGNARADCLEKLHDILRSVTGAAHHANQSSRRGATPLAIANKPQTRLVLLRAPRTQRSPQARMGLRAEMRKFRQTAHCMRDAVSLDACEPAPREEGICGFIIGNKVQRTDGSRLRQRKGRVDKATTQPRSAQLRIDGNRT